MLMSLSETLTDDAICQQFESEEILDCVVCSRSVQFSCVPWKWWS